MSAQTYPASAEDRPLDLSLRRPGVTGLIGVLLLVCILGGWTTLTVIEGAVVTQGNTVVKGKPQVVQSLDGGIVAGIEVRDGDIVEAGQVMLRLDPTVLSANLDIARSRLAAALALRARLQAEREGADRPDFAYPSLPFDLPDTRSDELGQREIFEARKGVRVGSREKLTETLAQFDNQIEGAAGQISAIDEQLSYITADIRNQQSLLDKGLARQSQLNELNRARSELSGRRAALQSDMARLSNARKDAEISTLQQERGFLEDVVTQLREVTTEIEELILDIATRGTALDRVDIRAPTAGIVHEMQISTPGAVLAPGGTVAQVVPLDKGMDFDLRVDPREIDQVHVGQDADVIITAFDRQTAPKLAAHVTSVSADAIMDEQTGRSFYRVNLSVPAAELARLEDNILKPGMPVEAYLKTGDRTVLSYLLQPVTSHLRRAFRE
jgi:HlyD family secretion protein|tara:strand:- start:4111 stop:5433 length:1323 start_codon:yes stop_codon:yes gene_type:complete